MHNGEEQFLEGLIDWDGLPNRKYEEYKQIATEFRKIEGYGFPYHPMADVALAFSFPSQIVSAAFPETHESQLQTSFDVFSERNINIDSKHVLYLNLKSAEKEIHIPGHAKSILHDREMSNAFKLPAFEPEFIELD